MFLALLVYVDDIILADNDLQNYLEFKAYLNDCFRIKDLGPLKYFLGLEVARGLCAIPVSTKTCPGNSGRKWPPG